VGEEEPELMAKGQPERVEQMEAAQPPRRSLLRAEQAASTWVSDVVAVAAHVEGAAVVEELPEVAVEEEEVVEVVEVAEVAVAEVVVAEG
jgi:hypothetical protein